MEAYKVTTDQKPSAAQLKALFDQEKWSQGRSLGRVDALLKGIDSFAAVYVGDNLIGFGRAISDGQFRALVEDVIVHSSYRGQGVGNELLRALNAQLTNIDQVFLNTSSHLENFYAGFGYKSFDGFTMVKQK